MVKLFLGNRAGVLLLIPLLIAIYFLLNKQTEYYAFDAYSNLGLWGKAVHISEDLNAYFSAILIGVNALFINWIYNKNQFLEKNSYISSLLYVTLMSFYHSFYSLDGIIISHTALIAMLYQFFQLRQNEDGRRHVFNGAFYAGIAASFHPPIIVLFPLYLFMIYIARPLVLRESVLAIVGFGIPLLYSLLYLQFSEHEINLRILEQTNNYYKKQNDFLVTSVLFTLLFILGFISLSLKTKKSSSRLKKLIQMLWVMVLFGIIFGFFDFFMFGQVERFSFLVIPLSFYLSYSFGNKSYQYIALGLFYTTFIYSLINFFF